jgi:two-component system, LytTR family, response regulator
MTLTAIAIDDEPSALDVIRIMAEKVPFLALKECFTNAFSGINYLQRNRVDLLFLDIKMPDITGIELLNSLPTPPMVVFSTAYSQYAVEGFELNALDYLLKPFSLARFIKACNKALEHKLVRNKEPLPYIFVKTGYEEEKVMLDDIRYIVAEGNYLNYVLPHRKLMSRQNMTEALQQLPPGRFVRVHRSYIVAMSAVEKIGRTELLVGGTSIPVGASFEEQLEALKAGLKN